VLLRKLAKGHGHPRYVGCRQRHRVLTNMKCATELVMVSRGRIHNPWRGGRRFIVWYTDWNLKLCMPVLGEAVHCDESYSEPTYYVIRNWLCSLHTSLQLIWERFRSQRVLPPFLITPSVLNYKSSWQQIRFIEHSINLDKLFIQVHRTFYESRYKNTLSRW